MRWGIDISRYDDALSDAHWQMMVDNGLSFAIIRACHGVGYTDPLLSRHVGQANKYGIPFGLYQWVDITHNVQDQANYFLRLIESYRPKCAAGDFEQYWTDWTAWNNARLGGGGVVPVMPPEQINAINYAYFTQMRSALSIPLVSYTGAWFVNRYCPQMAAWLGQSYLWLAGYISTPAAAVGWDEFQRIVGNLGSPIFPTGINRWDIWQFSASLPITGLPQLDLDAIVSEQVFKNMFVIPKIYEPGGGSTGKARVIASDGLRVRAAPNLQAQILRGLPYGTLVEIIEIQEGWARLADGGWCLAQWLQLLSEPPADTTPPAAITNLAAVAGTATGSIDLAWTAPGDDANSGTASRYLVRYATRVIGDQATWEAATPVSSDLPAPKPAGGAERMTVSGLTPGTTYYFAVRAQDEASNLSGLSNSPWAIAKAPADTTPPAAITNLAAVAGTATGSIDLAWTAPGDDANSGTASRYLVRYATRAIGDQAAWEAATPVSSDLPAPKPAGGAERMTVSGLTPGTTYYFAVRAQDEASNLSGLSNSPWAIATAPPPQALPRNAKVIAGIGLRVRAAPNLQAQILRGLPYGTLVQVVEIQEGWARLADGGWCVTQWLQFVAEPPADTTPPAAITNLAAVAGTATGSIDLAWTAPGDDANSGTASRYLVRYATRAIGDQAAWEAATPVSSDLPAPKPAGGAERMTVSGLTPGTTYYFAVRAQDEASNLSGLSNSPWAIAKAPPPLALPRNAKVIAGIGLRVRAAPDPQAQILRTLPFGAQVVIVEIREGWARLADGGWCVTQWLQFVAEPPQTTPPADTTPPAAITNLAAVAGTATGSIDLAWTAPGDDANSGTASRYLVRYATRVIGDQAAWEAATPVSRDLPAPKPAGGAERMTVSGLTPGTTYYFAVRAQDEASNLSGLSNSPWAIAKAPPPLALPRNAKVIAGIGLRVRATPDLQAQILRALPFGAIVEVVEVKDGWARLADGGWCAAQWLEMIA